MNKNKQIFELYIDYLVTLFRYTTATGLSNLLDGALSHDQVTRFLSHKQFISADLWLGKVIDIPIILHRQILKTKMVVKDIIFDQ